MISASAGALDGGLLLRRGRSRLLDGPEQRDAPRAERIAQLAVLHLRPLDLDDRAAVADELTGKPVPRVGREELRGLELLRHEHRLRLGSRARLVVAREDEEDDEPGEDGEAGRKHPEDA